MRMPVLRSVTLQATLVLGVLGLVALAPPARGPMLLVPLGADAPAAIRVATAHGARLLGPGPAGAPLVWADREVTGALLAAGVLPLAAPFSACGATPA